MGNPPRKQKIKILVVGQTPPPHGGQAIMIQNLLAGEYDKIKLFHARMDFSKGFSEVGKFRVAKLFHLAVIIAKIIFIKIRHRIHILYYPPAGPDLIPVYRDFLILIMTRYLFKNIVFHFHAGGLSEIYNKLPALMRILYRAAYFRPDLAIRVSEFNPPDGEFIGAQKNIIIPYGINDHYPEYTRTQNKHKEVPSIISVGVLRESKGVMVLLEACHKLMLAKLPFTVKFVGDFQSDGFRKEIHSFIERNGLEEHVEIAGVLIGDDKWKAYAEADIFCFPSFFESETFGIVLLEAMQFRLPVIATRWRGIPSIVEDGISGFLIDIKDSDTLADKISVLLKDEELRRKMGKRGREIYLERFMIDKFRKEMEAAFLSIV